MLIAGCHQVRNKGITRVTKLSLKCIDTKRYSAGMISLLKIVALALALSSLALGQQDASSCGDPLEGIALCLVEHFREE
jgi:hypothetical protein